MLSLERYNILTSKKKTRREQNKKKAGTLNFGALSYLSGNQTQALLSPATYRKLTITSHDITWLNMTYRDLWLNNFHDLKCLYYGVNRLFYFLFYDLRWINMTLHDSWLYLTPDLKWLSVT